MNENLDPSRVTNDLSGLISGILSNPDTLSKMTDIISKLGLNTSGANSPLEVQKINENTNNEVNPSEEDVLLSANSTTSNNFEANNIISKMPDILSKISSIKGENSIIDKKQIALLLAIRPYLSEHRKELIDTFIKMDKIGAVFKNLT